MRQTGRGAALLLLAAQLTDFLSGQAGTLSYLFNREAVSKEAQSNIMTFFGLAFCWKFSRQFTFSFAR